VGDEVGREDHMEPWEELGLDPVSGNTLEGILARVDWSRASLDGKNEWSVRSPPNSLRSLIQGHSLQHSSVHLHSTFHCLSENPASNNLGISQQANLHSFNLYM
jgi:hypothetical protein